MPFWTNKLMQWDMVHRSITTVTRCTSAPMTAVFFHLPVAPPWIAVRRLGSFWLGVPFTSAHGLYAYHHSQETMVTAAAAPPLPPTRL